MRSASAPQTLWPARTCSCRTGYWIRALCMSMRPAGEPRCGPRVVDRDHAGCGVLCDRRALQPRAVQRADRPLPGIVISDRWNGYSHLDPNQRQVCWSHLQRDFRRHADGLAEQKAFGEKGFPLTKQVFAAWRSYQREHHDATPQARSTDPSRATTTAPRRQPKAPTQSLAPPVRQQPAQGLARALDLHPDRWDRTDRQPRRARAPRTVIHRKLSLGTKDGMSWFGVGSVLKVAGPPRRTASVEGPHG